MSYFVSFRHDTSIILWSSATWIPSIFSVWFHLFYTFHLSHSPRSRWSSICYKSHNVLVSNRQEVLWAILTYHFSPWKQLIVSTGLHREYPNDISLITAVPLLHHRRRFAKTKTSQKLRNTLSGCVINADVNNNTSQLSSRIGTVSAANPKWLWTKCH